MKPLQLAIVSTLLATAMIAPGQARPGFGGGGPHFGGGGPRFGGGGPVFRGGFRGPAHFGGPAYGGFRGPAFRAAPILGRVRGAEFRGPTFTRGYGYRSYDWGRNWGYAGLGLGLGAVAAPCRDGLWHVVGTPCLCRTAANLFRSTPDYSRTPRNSARAADPGHCAGTCLRRRAADRRCDPTTHHPATATGRGGGWRTPTPDRHVRRKRAGDHAA